MPRLIKLFAAAVMFAGFSLVRAAPPASQPAGEPLPLRPAMVFERTKEIVSSLKLTDAQKTKVNEIFSKAAADLKEMRADLEKMSPPDRQREMMQFFKSMKDDIASQLDKDQLKQLEEKIEEEKTRVRQKMRNMIDEATTRPAAKKETAMMDDKMAPDMMSAAKNDPKVDAEEESKNLSESARGPSVGDAAPDFQLKKLDGTVVSLSQLKGRLVVIEFGSYSCPVFRAKAAAMEELKSAMGQRATFLVVYTKEAHPAGKWDVDRNKDDGISVEEPSNAEGRKTIASKAREKLKITIPIALDEMNNTVAEAYGLAPNGAVIIGRDGKIVTKQKWVDPFALRIALDEAVAAKPTTKPIGG